MLRFPFSCTAAICHDERLRIYSQLRLWINPFSLQSAVQLAMKHEVQYLAMKLAAQSVWRELTERNRSQIWHYHTKILYINPQICPHLVHRLLSFSWVTRRRFSTCLSFHFSVYLAWQPHQIPQLTSTVGQKRREACSLFTKEHLIRQNSTAMQLATKLGYLK